MQAKKHRRQAPIPLPLTLPLLKNYGGLIEAFKTEQRKFRHWKGHCITKTGGRSRKEAIECFKNHPIDRVLVFIDLSFHGDC